MSASAPAALPAAIERGYFDGRVAAITGGASGIGRAIALALARAGASAVIADVALEGAEDTAAEIRRIGTRAIAARIDVSREEDAGRMVRAATNGLGRLDFLVCCAGNASIAPVLDLTEQQWRSLIDVHLTGTFLCCRAAFDAIAEAHGGIVTMSSSYGFKGRPTAAHYSAAKAGIFGFTRVLATELAPNATANAIAPGPIDTPRWRAGLSDEDYAAKKAKRVKDIPMGRMGTPEDVAAMALFLLGPGGRWVTGQVLHVNGGEFYP